MVKKIRETPFNQSALNGSYELKAKSNVGMVNDIAALITFPDSCK
jgi:hypothetical protein